MWAGSVLGRRSHRNTKAAINDVILRGRRVGCPLIATDGVEYYVGVMVRLLGSACVYGQVLKTRRNNRVVRVERRVKIGTASRLNAALLASEDAETLNTSFIERLNLTIRQGSAYLTFDTRTTFRRLRARATPAATQQFRRRYFGRQVRRADRRQPLTWASVPEDYDLQIRVLRRERGVSQAQFAVMIGAAGKAVVYQWEARKRCPSPVFWCRIMDLDPVLPDVAKTTGLSPPPPDH